MSLVVFQKIFFSVWKMLQGKRQNQKNKHSTQIDARVRLALTAFDGDRRCSTARSIDCDRREGEIAIDGAISRSVDRDLAKASSRARIAIDDAGACERRRLELGRANGADWVSVSFLRSLSLSLEFI